MNQIYACRKGREIPFPGTTRMTTDTKAPDSSGRGFFAKLLMGVFVFLAFGAISFGQTRTYNSSGTYVVPPGVTSLQFDVTGAGGGGAGGNVATGVTGGGGGGGSFQRYTCVVVPGTTITITVGTGGVGGAAATPGGAGTITQVIGTSCVISQAGAAGGALNAGGAGAGAANNGGNGGNGLVGTPNTDQGGGGGGEAASFGANGNDGGVGTAAGGGIGGNGGPGANGGNGGYWPDNAQTGGFPGGGGGGGGTDGILILSNPGKNGGGGQVVITQLTPCPTYSAGAYGPFCQTDAAVPLTGTPTGGIFTGTGVVGAGPGGQTFDPAVAGPGCHTITYTYTDPNPMVPPCVTTAQTQILVYPSNPTLAQPANTCQGTGMTVTPAVVAGFTQQYSYDGGGWVTTTTGPTTPGCHTVTSRYVNTAACGATAAGTPGPCAAGNTRSAVVFPTAPVITNPANVCQGSSATLPTVTAVAGFNVTYSVDGGAFAAAPSTNLAPGCHSVQARYELAAVCGPTGIGAIGGGACGASNVANWVTFPTAPVLVAQAPVCAPTPLPLPPVAAVGGFTVEYSINGGGFTAAPVQPTTPGTHTVAARYVTTAACGTIPAGTAGPALACQASNTVTQYIVKVPQANTPASTSHCCTGAMISKTYSLSNPPLVPSTGTGPGGTMFYDWSHTNPLVFGTANGTVTADAAGNATFSFQPICNATAQTTTFTVVPRYVFGGTTCTGTPVNYTITIFPATQGVIELPANQTICAGQNGGVNVTLSGTQPFNGTFNINNNTTATNAPFNWTSNLVGGPQNIAIPTANIPNATNTPITYTITWISLTDANGCTGLTSGATNITVNPLPQVTVSSPADVCPGNTITWNINPAAGNTVPYTYNYTITATPAQPGFPVTGSNIPSATNSQTITTAACPTGQNTTYTISVTPFAVQAPNCPGSTQTDAVLANDVTLPVFTWPAGMQNVILDRCNAAGIAAARAAAPTATSGGCPAGAPGIVEGAEAFAPSCGYTTGAGYQTGETGVITTVFTATDACGNVQTTTQTITINDNTAPTWTTAPGALNQTVNYCDNAALTAAQALNPSFSDGCAYPAPFAGIAPVKTSGIFAQGACPTQGTITNTWTVTDPCGNVSTTFTQVITVVDTQGPSITGSNTQTLNIGAGANCQVSLPNYINGTGGIAPNAPLTPLTITDCAVPGAFPPPPPIVWNQAGGNGTAVQSPAPGTLIIGAGGQVVPVTITATDACGNTSSFTINVTLLDQTPPVARCHNATAFLSSTVNGGTVTITPIQIDGNNSAGAPAGNGLPPSGTPAGSGLGQGSNPSTDNCSPVPTPPLSLTFAGGFTSATYTCANIGANPITLTVTDAAGNATNCNATITIVDNTRPTFTCPGPQTIAKNANCIATLPNFPATLGLVATDNCTPSGSIVWTQTPAAGTIYGAGVTTATVTLTATDASGNVSSPVCNITVNFVDNSAPVITCPPTVNATTGAGNTNCNVAVTYTLPTATDNCQGPGFPGAVPVTLVSGPASGGQFFVGTTAVTYRATDAVGNSATCTFNVVVTDNTLPSVVCVSDQTVNAGAGCIYTYNLGSAWNPAPYDNCLLAAQPFTWQINGGIPFAAANLNGRTFPLGVNTVSVTATDASGNVSIACTFNVTVVDANVPAFTSCPSSFTVTTGSPNGLSGCRANVTLPVPTTTQNCTTTQEWFITSITSGTPNSSGVGPFPTTYPMNVGVTQVQYRLSDANGNSTTCTYNVTVNNVNAGAISGTATAAQNAATTSTITFTGSGGTPNYCFTYDVSVNGGPFGAPQTVCTTGGQSTVTVAQSNAVVGTYQYRILSVTDANGCAGTLTAPTTATVTVVAGTPDLTSSQFFTTTQISAGGVIDEVIVLRNVGTAPTSGPISFTITNYSALTGLTVTQTAAGTNVTIGIDTYTISGGWTFNSATGTFTSNNVIPAGGSNNIGIRITRGTGGSAGANGSVTQTTTIAAGTGGGETPSTNNTISNTILKN